MRVNDLILSLLVLVAAAALAAVSLTLPPIPGQRFGAAVFPLTVACGAALCGVILAVGALRAGAGPAVSLSWVQERGALPRVAATLVLVVFYILAAPVLGFLATAILTLLALFLVLRVPIVIAVPVAAVTAAGVYFAFANLLRVPLPRGFIEGWL
ncbi:tripartite tricarboxylate transporter TctB family protein [Aquabacter sp. P-9]|uniref:tripartite tricarboxylate transporter TctB family protein n=1 Tax=Aquabacter sediminis TaxID=3029197 RepID=UPI00237E614F|nr:tripartite tricarboxylate transporter TctB family protein [Aquabacter sp. P-9]MDE1569739.1 tripartite tricarboxylate transporter TctB family protein [Aquabacter sp. P-9]